MPEDIITRILAMLDAIGTKLDAHIEASALFRGSMEARMGSMERRLNDHMVEKERLSSKAHKDAQAMIAHVDKTCKQLHEDHVARCQTLCAVKEQRIRRLEGGAHGG